MTAGAPAGRKPVFLVVDDDRDFLALAKKMLGNLGFDAQVAATADEFLRKFKAVSPRACLVDLKLGSAMEGFQLLETVRMREQSEIPLFVASAESDSKIIAHAMELGATDYIVKPIDASMLATKLSPYFVSEGIAESRKSYKALARDVGTGVLAVEFRLCAVDENGLTLQSPSLVSKGSQVRVSAPLFAAMTGQGEEHLLTVASSWADTERGVYLAYAEFDPTRSGLLTSVRRWLVLQELK